MIQALTTATRANISPVVCWWNEKETSDLVNEAVKIGWVNRYSVTQVEWTEKGVEEYKKAKAKETHTSLPIANGKYTLETYTNANGKHCMKFTTQRGKVLCNFYYRTEQERDAAAVKRGEYLENLENERSARRDGGKGKKIEAIKNVVEGTIFYTCWGYEQTNVDFYQVISISGLRIRVRRTKQRTIETGFMSGNTTPIANEFFGDEVFTVGLTNCGGFRIDGHYANIHENCREHSCSWYG